MTKNTQKPSILDLTRREREIMDVIYMKGEATAAEVQENMESPPSYSTVRRLLAILEEKGYLVHQREHPRYVFRPTVSLKEAQNTATGHLARTFFRGSAHQAVATLLDCTTVDEEELAKIEKLIEEAKTKEQ